MFLIMMVSLMMIMKDFWLIMRFFSVAAYVCVCSKSSIRPNPSRSSFTTRALGGNLEEKAADEANTSPDVVELLMVHLIGMKQCALRTRLQMKLIPVQM